MYADGAYVASGLPGELARLMGSVGSGGLPGVRTGGIGEKNRSCTSVSAPSYPEPPQHIKAAG